MRNAWKGLVVGGLTGLLGGALLDGVSRASGLAREMGGSAKAHVHDLSQRVHDASEHVDVGRMGDRMSGSAKDLAHAAKDVSVEVAQAARHAARDATSKSS